jgi:hypothetical protein
LSDIVNRSYRKEAQALRPAHGAKVAYCELAQVPAPLRELSSPADENGSRQRCADRRAQAIRT